VNRADGPAKTCADGTTISAANPVFFALKQKFNDEFTELEWRKSAVSARGRVKKAMLNLPAQAPRCLDRRSIGV
jgi:hypothetical protein